MPMTAADCGRMGLCADRAAAALMGWRARVPSTLFLALAYLGALGGALLGAVGAVVLLTVGGGGDAYLALFTLMSAVALGGFIGVLVGMLNGAVIAGLSRTFVLRGKTGVSRNRATATAVLTTGLGSLGILHVVMIRMSTIFIYAPAIAGTLLAWPLSRKLPLARHCFAGVTQRWRST